jgi:hypothetical protein
MRRGTASAIRPELRFHQTALVFHGQGSLQNSSIFSRLFGRDIPSFPRKDNMGWSDWEEFRRLTTNDKTNLQEQE